MTATSTGCTGQGIFRGSSRVLARQGSYATILLLAEIGVEDDEQGDSGDPWQPRF